jgi:hypothetical protein
LVTKTMNEKQNVPFWVLVLAGFMVLLALFFILA